MSSSMTPKDVARFLLSRGFSVFPVPPPRPGVLSGRPGDGKVPALAWSEFQKRLATEAEIACWFDVPPMNIAIVTGALSDAVVVDADSPEALSWCVRNLPRTPWQVKTSKGFHLFYRHFGSRVGNRARVETKDGKLAI